MSLADMHWIDWAIMAGMLAFLFYTTQKTRRITKSSADFLAADRMAGRYLLTIGEEAAGLAAIGIIAGWQVTYKIGFAAGWWANVASPVAMMLTIFGWCIYRYRETRVLTLAQFLEIRYSHRFRIFAGLLCFTSGILNFGIFPAVGADFFMNYCSIPAHIPIPLVDLHLPTYPVLVTVLVGLSLYVTFTGGQIAVLVTDFFQSMFCNAVLLLILVFILLNYSISEIFEGLMISKPGQSMVNPFDAGRVEYFDPVYHLIGIFFMFFNRVVWQGAQAYQVSARSPHEAKMAGVLAQFRGWAFLTAIGIVPLVAYMIMHHPDYQQQAATVTETLNHISDDQTRDQMIVPITMRLYLPIGMLGGFAALMLAAFISTHDTYLHSWGSIFVQDVIMPLRKKPLDNTQHMRLLRLSTVGVALFIIVFSCTFRQTMPITLWFRITGAIWMGGIGPVVVGGLYTRWGNTRGAFASLIVGSSIGVAGIVLDQLWTRHYGKNFFLHGQWIYFVSLILSIMIYTIFSLLGKRESFNLEKMLHRGKYAVASDHSSMETVTTKRKWHWSKLIAVTPDFTRGDKWIYGIITGKTFLLLMLFFVMTGLALIFDMGSGGWCKYHRYMVIFNISTSFIIAIWLTLGGFRDVFRLFRDLKTAKRDFSDDGTVREDDQ